jgi:hypothetical protein
MAENVGTTLKELASISQSLNEASDLLSTRIAEVEAALQGYNLGVEAWVEQQREAVSEPDNEGRRYELTVVTLLGYGQYQRKWGLLVVTYCEETFDGEYDEECFLREAPRETRLAAVEKLPTLLKALAEKAAKVSKEATRKAEEARQIAAGLSRKDR